MSTILDVLNSRYTVFVGSGTENDVQFTDPETSPRHCQISKIGDNNFLIADLGSATGTFVNNKKIEKEFITEADFITVGGNIFQLTKKIPTTGSNPSSQSREQTASAPPSEPSFASSVPKDP